MGLESGFILTPSPKGWSRVSGLEDTTKVIDAVVPKLVTFRVWGSMTLAPHPPFPVNDSLLPPLLEELPSGNRGSLSRRLQLSPTPTPNHTQQGNN